MDIQTILVAAPGYIVTLYAALAVLGKLPARLQKWDKARIETEHHKIVMDEQLARIAPLAEDFRTLVENQAAIMKGVMPNGGGSLADKMTRIESEVKVMKCDIAELLREKTIRMQEQANHAGKIAILEARVEKVERKAV